jgi:hypothetical protein
MMLLPTPPSDAVGNNAAFGRFTTTEDEYILATGTLVVLDDAALAIARGFVRSGGRGIANPVRCAEAVYRHIIRNGASTADWRGPIGRQQPKLPFEPGSNPLDALAAAWAALDREFNPEEIAQARSFAGQDRFRMRWSALASPVKPEVDEVAGFPMMRAAIDFLRPVGPSKTKQQSALIPGFMIRATPEMNQRGPTART